ncbi:MAG: helix-turn-helix transcriptional regulator [Lactimicrobium massiliense]|nr:helix-turn-helix transcriptional regulator [Lactimicrobium massiliense]MDD6675368.1 helix-turn-helix transcriptional regulator [Lactimicrobium massiliense]
MSNNSFDDVLQEQLPDPEIRAEYAVIQALIDARHQAGLTQKELARRTGIAQPDISKLEHGNANPSVRTLLRLAKGMGMQLKIEFIPVKQPVVK